MRLEPKDKALFQDMRRAASAIKRFTAKHSRAKFLADELVQRAVERELAILGEAARALSEGARQAHPRIPFRQMIGLRNLLIHDYGRVDVELVWAVVKNDIPALLRDLKD